ncbi:MAG: sugar ABC transporter permease [Spirochaetia bacterium]|nr:sugar ABC transporter permease [Spirochaetia bacterium]
MNDKTFFSFVSPSVIIMVLLMVIPLITAVVLGLNFVTYSNLENPEFVGLQNYKEMLLDPEFWASFKFTFIYIITVVPSAILLGFIIAMLLDQVTRFRGVFIAAALIPHIITPVVGSLMFRTMFDRSGLYWYWLKVLFDYEFIMTTPTVRLLIILQGIWQVTPFAMITLFAGLQTLPKQLMEAATVDGANPVQKLEHVILPHLRSLFLFISLMGVMDAYRVLDQVLVITKQNPLFQADTIMYYNYKVAVMFGRLGKANAMSVLTVIGIFIVLIPFLRITYKQQMESR